MRAIEDRETPADDLDREARASVRAVLETLSEEVPTDVFVERLYTRFFAERPDVIPLFGTHALAEREEMVQETLRSVWAYCEGEDWLEDNLRALGLSHAEYGVRADMYPAYVTAFLDTLRELLAPHWPAGAADERVAAIGAGVAGTNARTVGSGSPLGDFQRVLEAICATMSAAGSD